MPVFIGLRTDLMGKNDLKMASRDGFGLLERPKYAHRGKC